MAQSQQDTAAQDAIAAMVKQVLAAMNQGGTQPSASAPAQSSGHLDAKKDYPLAAKRPDLVQSASGLQLNDITLEKVVSGQIKFEDIKIRPETLEYQAQIAESAGRPHLAANMRRAAELTRVPDARVLEIYNSLRPYRCTKQEMLDIAAELENQYQAKICAALVREAADVYEKAGRLKAA
ncbi:diol dehydratase small subunit [Desulfogranum japonicum]|uniref:diol dehydratase small subunit n=1 Tax=Desulfogranum japonicum TaxID=231447 RepID=UPI000411693F|nr:diol dehydratase small subunit [Desulfogranum japonicum]